MRLEPRFRVALYTVLSTLFGTGLAWLVVDRLKDESAREMWSRTSASLLMLHGGAAMLMLVLFGSLLPSHVRVAWRRRQNRATGTVMLAWNAVLIMTAFGLYYAGSETFRGWLSGVHTGAGIGLPALVALHVVRGRRSRRRAQHPRVRLSGTTGELSSRGRRVTNALLVAAVLASSVALAVPGGAQTESANSSRPPNERYYLPNPAASRIVTVTATGAADAEVIVLTRAVAEKETGPSEVVARFGEIYTFSPPFIALHRDEPTELGFWNLQPDDEHDVMLLAPDLTVLMKIALAPLTKTSYVFTFHQEGLFRFHCTFHQPAMSGQILVLPPRSTANH